MGISCIRIIKSRKQTANPPCWEAMLYPIIERMLWYIPSGSLGFTPKKTTWFPHKNQTPGNFTPTTLHPEPLGKNQWKIYRSGTSDPRWWTRQWKATTSSLESGDMTHEPRDDHLTQGFCHGQKKKPAGDDFHERTWFFNRDPYSGLWNNPNITR